MLTFAMITQASLLVFLVEFLVFYDEVIDVSREMWMLLCNGVFISPVLFFEMFGAVFGTRDWLVPLTANILTVAVLAGGYLIILKRKHVA
ncbi:MAG: hypothetical protein HGB03_01120 [Candidatus Yonathbacteria bacterium]|nr:hypothetical protein [Candidatus Yonathbacteria bacterium]NTW47865.1 hypothetical protein [Candidatus Yonathbacteria bacterium]